MRDGQVLDPETQWMLRLERLTREPAIETLPIVEKAGAYLSVAVDGEEGLLNLVETHAHAKLPPDARLVKPATRAGASGALRLRVMPRSSYHRRAMTLASPALDRRTWALRC